MLKFMRDRLGKTFLILIVAAISVVFVLFGVFPETNMGGGATGTTVASVGGEKITAQQLQGAVERELENYRSLGMDLPPELIENIKRGTLNNLVQGKLLLVEARRLGIQASDREVVAEVQKIPHFIDKDKKTFSVELYKKVLAANGLTPGQFEDDIRQSIIHQRMQKFLSDRIRVTPLEVEREFKISNETRNLSFVRFSREDAMKRMTVQAKDVDAFLADAAKAPQLNAFYVQNNLRYNQPEKVCARHILKRSGRPTAQDKGEAPKDFLDLKPSAGNFAELAKKYSEDPGSKTKGGDLDCFPRGAMDKAFEDAAFSLPVGKVSAPVKSQFGWHYILVSKKIPAVNQPLDKVRREIAEELIKRDKVSEIRELNLASAQAVVKNWKGQTNLQTTGSFNSLEGMIPKIGRAEEILKAAFDPKAPIQTGPQVFESQGGVIVAMVKERRNADMAKFRKEQEMHAKTLHERKLRAFLPAWLENVKERTKISLNPNIMGQL